MRFTDKLNVRLVIYLAALPIILLYVLVVAGCVSTSPGVPNLYVMSLAQAADVKSQLATPQVRIGYFGMCIGTNTSHFVCGGTAGTSTKTALSRLQITPSDKMKETVKIALQLQGNIILFVIAIAGIMFLCAVFSIAAWKVQTKRKNAPARVQTVLKRGTVTLLWMSTALCIAASLSVTQTCGAIQWYNELAGTGFIIEQGKTVETLQWILCALSAGFSGGMTLMLSSRLPTGNMSGPSSSGGSSLGRKASF